MMAVAEEEAAGVVQIGIEANNHHAETAKEITTITTMKAGDEGSNCQRTKETAIAGGLMGISHHCWMDLWRH